MPVEQRPRVCNDAGAARIGTRREQGAGSPRIGRDAALDVLGSNSGGESRSVAGEP